MSERPLILVSNDDGYLAEGLAVLADELEALGEVIVVAPERPRSGVSRMITLHKPLRVETYGKSGRRMYCSGTPTDCIYIALNHLLPRRPDLVVSGINQGANLGDDVTYSGTVAAAFEAIAHGIPAVASSLVANHRGAFEPAARLTARVAAEVLGRGLPDRTLLNVNVPDGYDGVGAPELTRLGRRGYQRVVDRRDDPRGSAYYWIGGPELELDDEPGTDCNAIRRGVASVSPVTLDLNNHDLLAKLAGWDLASTEPT